MHGAKTFVDTSVLIYAYDRSAGEKHKRAGAILTDLWDTGLGILSTQVLQEFYVNVTAKIPRPLSSQKAKGILRDLLSWNVVAVDGDSILNSVDIQARYKYSFWDALIVQAAVAGGSEVLLSEDLFHGQVIESVTIKNPFIT